MKNVKLALLSLLTIVVLPAHAKAAALSDKAMNLAKLMNVNDRVLNDAINAQEQLENSNEENHEIKFTSVLICGGASAGAVVAWMGLQCFNFSGDRFSVKMEGAPGFVGLSVDAGVLLVRSERSYKKGEKFYFWGAEIGAAWGFVGGELSGWGEIDGFDPQGQPNSSLKGWAGGAFYSAGAKVALTSVGMTITAR